MSRLKFIVDNNCGKLSRWLRALGYDTAFINPIADDDLIDIAISQNRIILTRDTGILARRVVTKGMVEAAFIEGDDWRRQFQQVVKLYDLSQDLEFTRCTRCNHLLETITRSQAEHKVPPFVYRTQQAFFYCSSCSRFYWQGSHWQRMREVFRSARDHKSRSFTSSLRKK